MHLTEHVEYIPSRLEHCTTLCNTFASGATGWLPLQVFVFLDERWKGSWTGSQIEVAIRAHDTVRVKMICDAEAREMLRHRTNLPLYQRNGKICGSIIKTNRQESINHAHLPTRDWNRLGRLQNNLWSIEGPRYLVLEQQPGSRKVLLLSSSWRTIFFHI